MKKSYITPHIEQVACKMLGTLCGSEKPSTTPELSVRPGAAAPERKPY